MEDAIALIIDTVEESSVLGVCELELVQGYAHGDIIKKWIWSGTLAAALRKVNLEFGGRAEVPKNPGATLIRFSAIE